MPRIIGGFFEELIFLVEVVLHIQMYILQYCDQYSNDRILKPFYQQSLSEFTADYKYIVNLAISCRLKPFTSRIVVYQ